MPDDEIYELEELIRLSVRENFRTLAVDQGLLLPSRPALAHNVFDAILAGTGEIADTFTAGYDSGTGTSTLAFTLDFSILYGDGVSGDILTA
jgi:hypothetical protein